jgi:branched-chain amino acid transport system substrate-binding protein
MLLVLAALFVTAAIASAGCGGSTTTTTAAPATETTAGGGTETTAGGGTETTAGGGGSELVVGYAACLTGDFAVGDVPGLVGVEYEVKLLNDAGGIAGHPIRLVTKDMKSDPALGSTVTQELLDEGAAVILGPPFPGVAVGVIQTAAKKNVAVISVTSTQPEFGLVGGSPAYLAAFGDNVQAAATAEYALKQGYKTVFTMVSPDLSYTQRTPEFFVNVMEKGGGKMVGTENFSLGQSDFGPQVTKIAALSPQPDVIYSAMFLPDLGIFTKQLRAAGVTSVMVGADGFDTQEYITFAGKDAEGTFFSTHGFARPGSEFESFAKGAAEMTGKPLEAPALTSLGGDALLIIKAAIEAAGSIEPAAIGAALKNLQGAKVINGTVSYKGTNGVPTKDVAVVAIEGGTFVFKDQFIPSYIPAP